MIDGRYYLNRASLNWILDRDEIYGYEFFVIYVS